MIEPSSFKYLGSELSRSERVGVGDMIGGAREKVDRG